MKTIELSNETYDALKKLANDYFEQDDRATAMPIYFTVKHSKKRWYNSPEKDNIAIITNNGDACYESVEEFCEHLDDCEIPYEREEIEAIFKYGYDEGDDYVEYRVVSYEYEDVFEGVFLTAEACDNHIKRNKHHYSDDACSYGMHAWRNPEFDFLVRLFQEISENK